MRTAIVALFTIHACVAWNASLQAQEDALGPRTAAEAWRVRGLEPHIQTLIERGVASSPTFRRVVQELNASDVMVHVRHSRMPDGFRGSLMHEVLESNGVRYLRIAIDARGAATRLMALIAHELQHALEVARVPEVGRSVHIAQFFETIADYECRTVNCVETAAAIDVQEAVLRELR
jgi:hypothetical protein